MQSQFRLLKLRRFLPLFVAQFLGAFNDNLMKSTLVVMVAYGVWDTGPIQPAVLVSLAAALFILPFIVFTPFAGMLTDRYDKARIIRYIKFTEIGIVMAAIAAIYMGSTVWAFMLLFIMGAQSAFFAPGKLAILPQHLQDHELIGANALISTSTYIAILTGSLIATLLALKDSGFLIISVVMILCAGAGYLASRFIPPAPPRGDNADGRRDHSWNPVREIWSALVYVKHLKGGVVWVMLSISWFYFVAGALHAQFPNYAKTTLGVDTFVLSVFMAVFSIGVGVGGLLNNSLLRGRISARFVPYAALAIAFLCLDLFFASQAFRAMQALPSSLELMNIHQFLASLEGWRILADIFLLSVAGGLYVVPLRALVQIKTPEDHRARAISANALTDALFLLISSLLAALLLSIGFEVIELFLMLAAATFIIAMFMLVFVKKRLERL